MRIGPQRPVNPDAIVAPHGYRVEALITGLTFPSAISFGPGGELYLAEAGGLAGTVVGVPRVLRVDPDRSVSEIGRLENPIVGLVYRHGELLIGEDGPAPRILRVTAEGELQILVEGLPGGGDYGLSGLTLAPGGALLFGLGTRTNSGVVGLDNVARGWVLRAPEIADVPGADVELEGVNYVTSRPGVDGGGRVVTGGLKPFSQRSDPGETVRGSQRCSGAVYRLAPEGGELERLAWGLRSPSGVACAGDGRIFVTEGGMEERGSRPVAGAPDNLWQIEPGGFYGWPDYASGLPVTDARFRLPGHPQPRRLLRNAPPVNSSPLATFSPRSGVGRVDFSSSEQFGFTGQAFVALAGEWSNPAYPGDEASAGHRVVRIDPRTGEVFDFLVNRQPAPASATHSGGLERPFDVSFDPGGEVLYVVDLGEAHVSREWGLEMFGGTGVVWRITRARPLLTVPPLEGVQEPEAEQASAEEEDREEQEGEGEEEAPPAAGAGAEEAPSAATESTEPLWADAPDHGEGSEAREDGGPSARAQEPEPSPPAADEAAGAGDAPPAEGTAAQPDAGHSTSGTDTGAGDEAGAAPDDAGAAAAGAPDVEDAPSTDAVAAPAPGTETPAGLPDTDAAEVPTSTALTEGDTEGTAPPADAENPVEQPAAAAGDGITGEEPLIGETSGAAAVDEEVDAGRPDTEAG